MPLLVHHREAPVQRSPNAFGLGGVHVGHGLPVTTASLLGEGKDPEGRAEGLST